jgi:Tfp pilus assembly PilM family ATPase
MNVFQRIKTLPLGLDIAADLVSIVSAEARSDGFAVRETSTLDVPPGDAAQLDRKLAETIVAIKRRLTTNERRCVVAVPSTDVTTRVFRVPPGMSRREAQCAALLEADTIVDWPKAERTVTLDPIPGCASDMLLSIARSFTLARLVRIVQAGGLHPIAIDTPAFAWRRAVSDADAVLDLSATRAELIVFGKPIGMTVVFAPRLVDERLAAQIRSAFADARREGIVDVQRLAIYGTPFRFECIEALLRGDGYAISPVVLEGNESPTWARAFGLATWSVAARPLVCA